MPNIDMVGHIVDILALIVTALLVYITWRIAPAKVTREQRDEFKAMKFAHRGLHGNGVPENSLAAFRLAVEAGYGIETDVQLDSKGRPVIFHDDYLKRMCGDERMVRDVALKELKTLRLASTDEQIPTLEEFLDTVNGSVPLLIELKTVVPFGDVSELCKKVMARLDGYRGKYVIESFDPAVLEWFKKNRPKIFRGQLAMAKKLYMPQKKLPGGERMTDLTAFRLARLLFNCKARPHFIAYRWQDNNISVDICRIFGACTAAWTVTSKEDEARAMKNFDCPIFEQYRS